MSPFDRLEGTQTAQKAHFAVLVKYPRQKESADSIFAGLQLETP